MNSNSNQPVTVQTFKPCQKFAIPARPADVIPFPVKAEPKKWNGRIDPIKLEIARQNAANTNRLMGF